MQHSSKAQEIFAAFQALDRDEQERLLQDMKAHLKKCKQDDLCRDIEAARKEQRSGGCNCCEPDDLMQDILL